MHLHDIYHAEKKHFHCLHLNSPYLAEYILDILYSTIVLRI